MPDPSQPEASIEAEMSDSGARATPPDLPETTQPHQVRLILVRHGSSTWNEERRIQGQLDPPLSAKGEDQAARLAERLKDEKPAGFYSSDLARATATAGAIASRIGRRPVLLPGLREIALGEWEGLDREQIKAGYPRQWEQWTANPSWDIVPGSEGTKAFESRVGGGTRRSARPAPDGRGAHRHPRRRHSGRPSENSWPRLEWHLSLRHREHLADRARGPARALGRRPGQ